MQRFFDGSVREVARGVASGKLSAVELVRESLERIETQNSRLNAFVSIDTDGAIDRARAIDSWSPELRENKPLLGIPVAVKDNICTRGTTTTCSSRMLAGFVPPYNASVIEMIEEAGAVIVGKTNLDEFAMGSSTETSWQGATRNPVDPQRVSGGSSGGSAAAVAAGMVPLALGSDTGGSIRQPCSYCGVAGLKPTYGRVSRYGLVAFASSLDQIGPIAGDIRDIGLMLDVISRPDGRDSTCAGRQYRDDVEVYGGDASGLRIGVPGEYFGEGLDNGVREVVTSIRDALGRAGAELVDISLPRVREAIATYYIICTAEASSNLARYDGVKYGFRSPEKGSLREMYCRTRSEGFGPEVKRRIMLGTYVLSSGYYDAYYLKAAKVRTLVGRDFEQAFEQCDTIISPVTPAPAFKLGEKCDDPLQMYLTDVYTVSANMAGIPGVSVPCGLAGGLPVGVQFMAPKWREDTLLKAAACALRVSGS